MNANADANAAIEAIKDLSSSDSYNLLLSLPTTDLLARTVLLLELRLGRISSKHLEGERKLYSRSAALLNLVVDDLAKPTEDGAKRLANYGSILNREIRIAGKIQPANSR